MGSKTYVNQRLVGYSIGAAVHLGNILAMWLALQGPIMKDPDVEHFYSMQYIYITIWNLILQLLYIGMGFTCDLPVLLNMNNSISLQWLRSYRKIFYNGILWPCGVIIFGVFWPVFLYDRDLIFPAYIDKVLSQVSNYIMHLFILFPIVWDLSFLPNEKPINQKNIITHSITLYILYLIVLFGHFGLREKWPYPVLKLIYGTIYFPIVFILITLLLATVYWFQWPIISYVWRKRKVEAKIH